MKLPHRHLISGLSASLACMSAVCSILPAAEATAPLELPAPTWESAAMVKQPMTADEASAFIKRLHGYVRAHHLKTAENSPQRGMLYEYFNVPRAGKENQFVEGEALDTMHDGAWYGVAMVNATRATRDPAYQQFLTEYQLPFYCQMLNHSDTLFSPSRNDADAKAAPFGREHMLQAGEKGFVPYWWDDGEAVSLERVRTKNLAAPFPCRDLLAGKPNPEFHLSGYSLGSSNHLAQDLGVLIEQSWLLLRQSPDQQSAKLTAELADAAQNLHDCRMRHHGNIPMCDAPAALIHGDLALMKKVPDPAGDAASFHKNAYYQAFYDFKPGQKVSFPGFADDDEYVYYFGTARAGGTLSDALALKLIYDAFTQPLLYRAYCDDAPVPPGINRFDLHPYYAIDGKPADYRSDRKGPSNHARPIGSRMGPQNMIVAGWALQALRDRPGLWDKAVDKFSRGMYRVTLIDAVPNQIVLSGSLTTFDEKHIKVSISSSRLTLRISGSCPGEETSFRIYSHPGGKGSFADITLKRDKTSKLTNDQSQTLLGDVSIDPTADGGFKFDVRLPYTFVKGQSAWMNAVEFGTYSMSVAGNPPGNFVMASPEQDVKAALERELAGGLRTWEAIFDQYGYVPTGIGAGADWEHFSDTGGYAHLISAASEWILYLDGRADWNLQNVPDVLHGK